MAMDITDIIRIRHTLQSWSDDDFTRQLANDPDISQIPFCETCGDWHYENDGHSITDKDN